MQHLSEMVRQRCRVDREKQGFPLIQLETVKAEIQKAVDAANGRLACFETIKKFTILPRPLTVGTGEQPPTMTVRRKIVEAKFQSVLDAMYNEA